jgi:hypothetical protein
VPGDVDECESPIVTGLMGSAGQPNVAGPKLPGMLVAMYSVWDVILVGFWTETAEKDEKMG